MLCFRHGSLNIYEKHSASLLGFSSALERANQKEAQTTETVYLDWGVGYCRSLLLILLSIPSRIQKYLLRFWPCRSLLYPKIGKPDEIISVSVLGL